MASGGKRGAKERVLGSRHVIGLFMLMLVFSAIFFTLGYVMGRSQYAGQVGASSVAQHNPLEPVVADKSDPTSRHPAKKPAMPEASAPFRLGRLQQRQRKRNWRAFESRRSARLRRAKIRGAKQFE